MGVDPAYPESPDPAILNELQDLLVRSRYRTRQRVEMRENLPPIPQVAAGELADLVYNGCFHRSRLIDCVISSALMKSIRNAPTMLTTKKARGAGPVLRTISFMQAIEFAVVPSMKPQ